MAVEGVDAMIAVWTLQTSGTARSDNIYFDFTQDEETARTFKPHDDVAWPVSIDQNVICAQINVVFVSSFLKTVECSAAFLKCRFD